MTDLGIELSRKGKPKTSVTMEPLRELTLEDIAWLESTPAEAKTAPIKQLRHTHHLAARLLAEGHSATKVAEITGYSISRLSIMAGHDPAFQELVTYYKANVEAAFINVHERLAALGIHALEELQARLDANPEDFGNRELRELMTALMDRSVAPPKGTGQGQGHDGSTPRVIIQFVEPSPQALEHKPIITIEDQASGEASGEAK